MKIVTHKRKNKWATVEFTIKRISREDLSLILTFAEDGIQLYKNNESFKDLQSLIRKIEDYINGEEFKRLVPLEIHPGGKDEKETE